ncbi:MAG: ArnT family glycosyltransferase [Planctomycetia bacterium]
MNSRNRQRDSRGDDRPEPPPASGPACPAVGVDWVIGRLLLLVFICSLLYAIWTASIGWGNTLNDRHSFRQTQTATTAYWMIGKPFTLAYETPVLGKPWSIPMEFPLYQWIVARLVGLFGTPLDQTGRFVSLVFFLLTTIPLYRLVRSFGVATHHAWVPLILFVTSPFYIFWSRAFMIESTALFFSVAYLAAAMEASKNGARWTVALAVVFGALAALVKVTTFLVYLAVIGAIGGIRLWRKWTRHRDARVLGPFVLRQGLIMAIPFLLAVTWLRFGDALKNQNPIAAEYITSRVQNGWNFGTLSQKFSGLTWGVIVGRFPEIVGLPPLAWLLLGVTLAVTFVHRRRWRETLACLGAYLLAPAVFTNLYFIHDYYANANGIFLIAAIGFAIVGLFEDSATRVAGAVVATTTLLTAVCGHAVLYGPRQATNSAEVLHAAEYIQSATAEDSVIVCLSNDWSPLVSYYARRRALNLPMESDRSMPSELATKAFAELRGEKIGAIVLVEPVLFPLETAKRLLRDAGFEDVPVLTVKGLPKF